MDYEWIDLHALLTAITVGTNVDCSQGECAQVEKKNQLDENIRLCGGSGTSLYYSIII